MVTTRGELTPATASWNNKVYNVQYMKVYQRNHMF